VTLGDRQNALLAQVDFVADDDDRRVRRAELVDVVGPTVERFDV
jgi:hypothetical protein